MARHWAAGTLAALLLAGCSAAEPATSSEAATATITDFRGAVIDPTDLVVDEGPASLVLALAGMRGEDTFRGLGYREFRIAPVTIGAPCPQWEPLASSSRVWAKDSTLSEIQVQVLWMADEDQAGAVVDSLANRSAECAEAIWANDRESLQGIGMGELLGDPQGTLASSPVPGAATRTYVAVTELGRVDSSSTAYRDGAVVTIVHTLGQPEEFPPQEQQDVVAALYAAQRDSLPAASSPDTGRDGMLDVARQAAVPRSAPNASYRVLDGIAIERGDLSHLASACWIEGAPARESTGVLGPSWAAKGGFSFLTQEVWLTASADEAAQSAAALSSASPACGTEQGEPVIRETTTRTERVDGFDLVSLEVAITDPLYPDQDLRIQVIRVAIDALVLSTSFTGLNGDQPDLMAWTAVLAAELREQG